MPETLTIYITAEKLLRELRNPDARDRAAALLMRARFARVVLEGYRAGCSVPEAVLEEARDFFVCAGFQTLGGLMPLHGGSFGKRGEGLETRNPFFCYSSEDTLSALEAEIRKLARLFDQVVVDDAFLTSCRCAACEENRSGREWGAFRRDLLCHVAERFASAAHAVNPHARFTIKFPQYYDRYHLFGYDAARMPQIADAIWQGTETRDPDTLAYGYTEPYQGYFNACWMRACAGDAMEAAWFDTLDCGEQHFHDQAVTTRLAKPKHIVVFSYEERLLAHSKAARHTEALPRLERLAELAEHPQGVHVIKPPNSNGGGDLFLFDYLGMLGIPCVPHTTLQPTMRCAIVPEHGLDSPEVVAAIPKALMAGRTVIATFAALDRMRRHPALLEFFGYHPRGIAPGKAEVTAFELDGRRITPAHPIRLAGDLAPSDASILASALCDVCEGGPLRVPFITTKSYASGGRALVWNIASFGPEAFDLRERLNVPVKPDLLRLPKPVLDFLRHTATGPLGFDIKAPARVACFLFAHRIAFVNYTTSPAEIEVGGIAFSPASLFAQSPKTAATEHALLLAPNSYAMLEFTAQPAPGERRPPIAPA